MLDIDKWPASIQWILGFGVFIGGIIAAFFGTKIAGNKAGDDGDREREGRERDERSKRYTAERGVENERLENRLEKVIQALRESIFVELGRQSESARADIKILDDRLRDIERDVAVLASQLRPPSRRQ